jgi:hypothetical protein
MRPADRLCQVMNEGPAVGWNLTVYPDAREAAGRFVASIDTWEGRRGAPGESRNPERTSEVAASRARSTIRRYCVANATNRFWTLTYQDEGCHDPVVLRSDLGLFFRELRIACGGRRFPYVWVPEWHKTDHGLHAHFVCDRFIKRSIVEVCWQHVPGHGHVKGKLIGDLGVASSRADEARIAAGYIAKYMDKDFDEKRVLGLHRYDCAQGFQPKKVVVPGPKLEQAIERAADLMGAYPAKVTTSDEWPNWAGPSAVALTWAS